MTDVVEVRVPASAVLDVVFLHGLDGHAYKTWTAEGSSTFWPVWLAEDFDGVAVWSVGYEAWSSGWRGRAMPIQDRAVNLMAQLQNRGIGRRPLCFVTHSMGGLLAKEILLHAAEGRTGYAAFASAVRGVVFLGTPHTGSGLAGVVEALKVVYRATAAVKDLKRSSAYLRQLNDRYRDWAVESRVRNLVFFEAYPTKGVRVVDEVSANPGLPHVRPIPVDTDHVGICKLTGRHSLVYGQVGRFIADILGTVVDHDPGPATTGDAALYGSVRKVPADTGVFVGRTDELARLEEATAASGRVAVVAVHGLGGVGKSRLAAQFAEIHADRFSLVWWVTADSDAAIDNGLADLAAALHPDSARLPLEQRTEQAIGWLSNHIDWLLILDNLATPAHTARLLERVRTGTIVVTSRQGAGWRGVTTLPLDVLTPGEALDLLERIVWVEWPAADLTEGARLCAELGWLPLAVEQAGAYITHTRITPTRYLDLLARFPERMFTATAEGGDAQRTMARVWHVTLDRLANTPLAGSVLRRLAWFAPDRISRSFLAGSVGEPELAEALGRLAAYNMITLDADAISVHRLVQAVTRTPDSADPHRRPEDIVHARDTSAENLYHAVAEADHEQPADWPTFQEVLPHALALLDHTDPDTDAEPLCALANRLVRYAGDQGDTATAIALSSRATRGVERLYGPDHPNTLATRGNLAYAYESAGDLGRAVPLYEATLADREQVLGPDHPDTLTSRNNLAAAYWRIGDLGRAVSLFEATLAVEEQVHGPDHPSTLGTRHNLAAAYWQTGDLGRAIPMFEATLADQERILGPDHLATASSRNQLAYAYQSVGDPYRAIPMFEATLTDQEQKLGPDHPATLTSRNYLASAYESVGDHERAIPLFEATLADRKRVLGLNHPDTLTSQRNLAATFTSRGDPARAILLLEATLSDQKQILGPDHPDTLDSRNHLARAHLRNGDRDRAIPLFEATLADRKRVLGLHHPDTLTSRNNLAASYQETGDPGRAIPLLEETVADLERILGPNHPGTLGTRNNLAHAYQSAGDSGHAIPLYEATLADCVRALGTYHPLTRTIRSNLETASSNQD